MTSWGSFISGVVWSIVWASEVVVPSCIALGGTDDWGVMVVRASEASPNHFGNFKGSSAYDSIPHQTVPTELSGKQRAMPYA